MDTSIHVRAATMSGADVNPRTSWRDGTGHLRIYSVQLCMAESLEIPTILQTSSIDD